MIAGEALSAWLADKGAQKRSLDAVEASAREWSRHPLMGKLDAELTAMADPTPEQVLDAARRFMDQEHEIAAMLQAMIPPSLADPFFRPPFHPLSSEIHNGILLFHHPLVSIALGVTGVDMLAAKKAGPRGATSVGFTGQVSLYRYVKAGEATISFWECPPIEENFVASEAGNCWITGRRKIADGEELLIDGRHQSFIIEHATGEMVYFQAVVSAGAAPLTAEYDSKSMQFIGASSTDEASSRVQMMVSLLRTMEREDALPLIVEALESPHFYTRWHIMRELLAMDAEAAHAPLKKMAAGDPHPEVRAAAARTLEMFFPEAEATEGAVPCRA
jgi:hypothetical protein